MSKSYKTGDTVPATGMYVCQLNGTEKSFREGETFNLCPVTWQDTTWMPKKTKT